MLQEEKLNVDDIKKEKAKMVETMQQEVDFFKKEVGKLSSGVHQPLAQYRKPQIDETPVQKQDVEAVRKLDDIVHKAQASISKVMGASLSPQTRMNDSLDAMRLDFMNEYKQIMKDSGETFFKENHPNLNAQLTNQKKDWSTVKSKTEARGGGPLNQMVRAGLEMQNPDNVKEIRIENEQLKAIIDIMKVEMQEVLNKAQNNNDPGDPDAQLILQREIISKERRMFEIERTLRVRDEEVRRLKEERDRLVSISNELRAELNRSKRVISELKRSQGQIQAARRSV